MYYSSVDIYLFLCESGGKLISPFIWTDTHQLMHVPVAPQELFSYFIFLNNINVKYECSLAHLKYLFYTVITGNSHSFQNEFQKM